MSDAKETEDKSGTQGHLENVRASLKRSSLAPLLAEAEEKVACTSPQHTTTPH